MLLTKSVEYAIKSLILINYDSKINIEYIASKLDIPRSFTSKILQVLVKKGYISSKRGPGGGFVVNDYSKTLKDLICDIDHKFDYDKCVMGLSGCSDENACPLHENFKEIKNKILNELMILKISDICKNPNKVLKL